MAATSYPILLWAVLFGMPALAQTPAADPSVPQSAQALLDQAKQASGGAAWDKLTTTHDQGRATIGGLSGTYQDWLDWVHVKQAGEYALGPATGAQGWDGKTSWSVDASGQVRAESSAEAVAGAIEQAYFATFAMFFPGRFPAEIVYAGPRVADGVTFQAVKVTPRGSDPVEVWFDPATHLVARGVELKGAQPHTYLYGDYRDAAGVKLPFHTIARVGGDAKYDQVTDMQSLETGAVPDSKFSVPPPPAYDATFAGGKTAVTVPFRLLNNHIYLEASINGQPSVPFVFDTGATNFMYTDHAKKLGVKTEGAMAGGGFGNAISSVGLAKVASVAIGGLSLHDQVFATSDMGKWIAVEGADSAGLVGYEFAKRTVVTIDYAKHKITFTRPEAFHAPAGVAAIPFRFDAHIPMVSASIDGVEGEFEIDTGARSALTLMAPFAQAHRLIEKYHPTRTATTGYGVGGPSKALLTRVGVLAIGPVRVNQPVTDLVTDTRGAAADEHTAGNIGGDTLKRFTLTLDYGHQVLYLQPNALAAEPDVFDRSGLWVNRADDGMITIADVSADSAASKAGLKAGDRITAVNGHDSRTVEINDLRETFKRKPGTTVHLDIDRANGKKRDVALKLEDQV